MNIYKKGKIILLNGVSSAGKTSLAKKLQEVLDEPYFHLAAIGPSAGITIGGVIIPRIMFSHLYNETYPPVFVQIGLYFVVGYIASFLVSLLIKWIKAKGQCL